MPLGLDLKLTLLDVDFTLADGTVRSVTSKVTERGKEEELYEDKIASTKSALVETLSKQKSDPCFKRYQLGNMPPQCMVSLRICCVQTLSIEDMSYCFRIPVQFVPAYLGNSSCSLMVE